MSSATQVRSQGSHSQGNPGAAWLWGVWGTGGRSGLLCWSLGQDPRWPPALPGLSPRPQRVVPARWTRSKFTVL